MIPKYVSYSIDPLYELELRLVTMLAGLHTQTGLHGLIIPSPKHKESAS